jgi:molecular chaperone GrpE
VKEVVMSSTDREENKGNIEITDFDESSELEETAGPDEGAGLDSEEEAKKESDDIQQKYLRLAADFENYKKRLAKEKADVIAYGNEELIKALLNVLDNLERALEHADDGDPALLEGVKLVHKQFINCLEKFDVQKIESSIGTEFDPRVHQAIERVESQEISSGLILSEMLAGYTLKERLLRPALVVVSKGVEEPSGNDNVPGFSSTENT